MTASQSDRSDQVVSGGNPVRKHLVQMVFFGLLIAFLLFSAAGRLDWFLGWVYVVIWLGSKIATVLIVGRADPELIAERASSHADTRMWDQVVLSLYILMGFAVFLVAALDAGRFGWGPTMSLGLILAGIFLHLCLLPLTIWVMLSNTYTSREARIQHERRHRVVSSGPYSFLRHPLYLLSILLWLTTPLMLGSWWAFVPAVIAGAAMVVRTALEDRMLINDLQGYRAYSQSVRFRLLPGIW